MLSRNIIYASSSASIDNWLSIAHITDNINDIGNANLGLFSVEKKKKP